MPNANPAMITLDSSSTLQLSLPYTYSIYSIKRHLQLSAAYESITIIRALYALEWAPHSFITIRHLIATCWDQIIREAKIGKTKSDTTQSNQAQKFILLAPVVWRLDNAIHQINRYQESIVPVYPVDKC